MDILATQLEEGMEIKVRNSDHTVIVEGVENDPRKPFVDFYAYNGRAFRVPNEETFTVFS